MARDESEIRHPLFARAYTLVSRVAEPLGAREHRRELLAGLAGRVVEVGAGNGLNFTHYPATVTSVLAVEPEPLLRGLARRAAAGAPVPVEVTSGVAASLPLADGRVDAGVVSLVLCSVPDVERAVAELWRVIRPGGELRFYEHVHADSPRLAAVQRATDLLWPRCAGGCHTARDAAAAIARGGFVIERVRRFRFPGAPLLTPLSPHILGRARRPDVTVPD